MKKIGLFLIVVLLVIAIVAVSGLFTEKKGVFEDDPVSQKIEKTISIYFASDNINTLAGEKRTLKAEDEEEFYLMAVEELIKGPENKAYSATLHSETEVNSVKVSGEVATIDFTETLKDKNTGGSTRELMCIYSVVNTLCEFENINEVIFTINGKAISTFGQFDMSEPFKANKELIK